MPAKRVLPSTSTLLKWRKTMTHEEIAHHVYKETGYKVSRSSVSSALSRAGETNRVRYQEEIPWKVAAEHRNHYAMHMLRVKARINRGYEVTEERRNRLASWERRLEETSSKVVYLPDTEDGFYYVRKEQK